MRWWSWILIGAGVAVIVASVTALRIQRSRTALSKLARLVPLCVTLLRDLVRDPMVPRRAKIVPAIVLVYLVIPVDLIPDFIPVLGYLDDALIVAWAIRHLIAGAGRERVAAHWRGDPATLEQIFRLARIR